MTAEQQERREQNGRDQHGPRMRIGRGGAVAVAARLDERLIGQTAQRVARQIERPPRFASCTARWPARSRRRARSASTRSAMRWYAAHWLRELRVELRLGRVLGNLFVGTLLARHGVAQRRDLLIARRVLGGGRGQQTVGLGGAVVGHVVRDVAENSGIAQPVVAYDLGGVIDVAQVRRAEGAQTDDEGEQQRR